MKNWFLWKSFAFVCLHGWCVGRGIASLGVMADQIKSEVVQKFVGLTMSDLIAAPLTAVCESQMKLAQASYEYMMKIGCEDGVGTLLFQVR